ncbi:MAG: amidohydrolase [Planctomycetota bacterium]
MRQPSPLLSRLPILALLLAACAQPGRPAPEPPLLLHGGTIETMDPRLGRVEALGIAGGRVVAAGPRAEVAAALAAADERPAREFDLRGAVALPGFIDAHAHFGGIGQSARIVDLRGCADEAEMVTRAAAAALDLPPGAWVTGRGWDQNLWPGRRFPTRAALSAALPDHPCLLTRIDGHALLANDAAISAAGVTRDTPDPAGGEILRDAAGEPNGIFVDAAESLVRDAMPAPDEATRRRDLLAAQAACFRVGITSLHDAGIGADELAAMRALYASGELEIRLYVMLGGSGTTMADLDLDAAPSIGEFDERLTVRAWKVGVDGALGSRGAALLEDYRDRPGHRGLVLMDEDELVALGRRALEGGWQVCVHAIGDRGNRIALDAWERVFAERPEGRAARFRIEHAQILDRADIPRFARLGVVASMQTNHATSDLPWAEERLGRERVEEGAYAWRELIADGAAFCNGTDAPVEELAPLANLRAAVFRDWGEGPPTSGYHARQRLTRREAVASYTTGGAWAAFEEDRKGRLAPGMLGDVVILERDPIEGPESNLRNNAVRATIVGGRIVHRAE